MSLDMFRNMTRRAILPNLFLALASSLAMGADASASLSAAQIAEKGIAAIGGAPAWRAINTLSYSGKLDAGGKHDTELPFVLAMKRPRKTRVEIEFENDKALQVYDGANGWKFRPFLGRRDVEPISAEELKEAAMEPDLDGLLVDYSAKGAKVDLEGVEKVEGQDAYKLKLTMKGGGTRHLWVDAETFLVAKIEGVPRRMDGRMRPVEIHYRDYKNVSGLMVPFVLETTVEGVKKSHKMTIESVLVNPKLDDSLFLPPKSK